MFIRKWRYEQNLENARNEGRQEGQREATDRYYSTVSQLEKDKEMLTKALDAECKKEQQTIEAFAQELACLQKMADVAYHIKGDQEECSRMVDKVSILKELANKMGICGDVYERAYQIYDFRNSGMQGYILKDGKIVKVEQEKTALVCPFMEEQGQQNNGENSTGDETAVCCPEMSGLPDRCENCHVVQGFCDEESFF